MINIPNGLGSSYISKVVASHNAGLGLLVQKFIEREKGKISNPKPYVQCLKYDVFMLE